MSASRAVFAVDGSKSMNSEHRHELNQNVLSTFIGDKLKKVEPYSKGIAIGFAVVVFAVVGAGLYQNSATMAKSDATLELLQNANGGDAEALAAVGDRYTKTPAGALARLYEADTNLSAGITALFTDREDGETKINDAVKAYRDVTTTVKDRLLVSRANLGMGRALESIGKVEDAISAYKQVVMLKESDEVVAAAQRRIDLLEKAETQEFLAWFRKQDFKPADPSLPPSLPSGNKLPDLPDLDLPEIPALKLPDELKSDAGDKAAPAPGKMTLPPIGEADAVENSAEPKSPAPAPEAPAPEAPAPEAPAPEAPAPEAPAPEAPAGDNPTAPVTGDAE